MPAPRPSTCLAQSSDGKVPGVPGEWFGPDDDCEGQSYSFLLPLKSLPPSHLYQPVGELRQPAAATKCRPSSSVFATIRFDLWMKS